MGDMFVTRSDLCLQLIAEESQARMELKLALDSKDCDIERLRSQITSLSIHSLDTTSISSGNDVEAADGYPGLSSFYSLTSSLFCFPHSLFTFPLISPFLSADNSLSHLRVYVLHLPAHSQIRLH